MVIFYVILKVANGNHLHSHVTVAPNNHPNCHVILNVTLTITLVVKKIKKVYTLAVLFNQKTSQILWELEASSHAGNNIKILFVHKFPPL